MQHQPLPALRALPLLLTLLAACGGGEAPPGDVPPVPEPPASPYPPITCPEGATYRESETPQGVEQVCEVTGVLNGPFRRWHTAELRATDGGYAMGQPDGAWVWWFADGTKKAKGAYKAGKQAGSWTWWHESGAKIEEGDFLAGRKAGTWTRWYPSGKKKDEGMFHNGGKNGEWTYFRDDVENTAKRKEKWQAGTMLESMFLAADGKTKINAPLPEDVDAPETEGGAPGADPNGGGAPTGEAAQPAPAPR